jgi:hypothetical protein
LRALVIALMLLVSAFSVAGLALPTAARAATVGIDQCNGHAPGAAGATTAMRCTVTVVNTISGTTTGSTTTVTRKCALGPCSTPNGSFTTRSSSLVTVIRQCNSSDNDAAHAISCSVNITNNITQNTPGAQSLTAPGVTQCVGSGKGGGGVVDCKPAPATGATVTQCNGSGNGGGGAVHCTVARRSAVSAAISISVNQCNGTGNVGGSGVTCTASIITHLTGPAATKPAATTPAPTTPPATTTAAPSPSQSSTAAAAVVPNGAGSTGGSHWEGPVMTVAGLTLAGAIGALLYRRYAPRDLFSRFTRKG